MFFYLLFEKRYVDFFSILYVYIYYIILLNICKINIIILKYLLYFRVFLMIGKFGMINIKIVKNC